MSQQFPEKESSCVTCEKANVFPDGDSVLATDSSVGMASLRKEKEKWIMYLQHGNREELQVFIDQLKTQEKTSANVSYQLR